MDLFLDHYRGLGDEPVPGEALVGAARGLDDEDVIARREDVVVELDGKIESDHCGAVSFVRGVRNRWSVFRLGRCIGGTLDACLQSYPQPCARTPRGHLVSM